MEEGRGVPVGTVAVGVKVGKRVNVGNTVADGSGVKDGNGVIVAVGFSAPPWLAKPTRINPRQ